MSTHIQRDHLFNRSTRPLLETKSHHNHHSPLKKKSTKEFKVHGFNDFNFVANQYKNLNSNISYPYGGSPPPSPPLHSSIMHDHNDQYQQSNHDVLHDSGIHVNNISNLSAASTNYYEDIDNSYQLSSPSNNGVTPDSKRCNTRLDMVPHQNFIEIASRTPAPLPNDQQRQKQLQSQPQQQQRFNQLDDSGPFIFGVHTNNCNSFNNTTATATTKTNERNESVINNTIYSTKYSSIVTKRTLDSSPTYHDSGDVISQNQRKDQRLSEKGPNRMKKDKRQTRNVKKHAEEIKCVLVGDGMVGKTNLIMSYLENRFTTEHVPTASDIYNCEVQVDDLPVQITLCDTAGQDFFDPLRRLCYPDSDVFLLCFSVVKPKTFKSIQNKWAPNLSKSRASIVLVGTQADLRSDEKTITQLKNNSELPISKSDAWDYATSIGAKYIETSSRTNKGVKDAFDTAIWDAMITTKRRRTPPLWKRIFCFA